MQEASIPARHQAGSLIPGAPPSQFQHQEPNGRTGEAEIPSWRDLLSAQSSNTTHFPKPPQFLVLWRGQPRALIPTCLCQGLGSHWDEFLDVDKPPSLPELSSCHRILTKSPLTPWSAQQHLISSSTDGHNEWENSQSFWEAAGSHLTTTNHQRPRSLLQCHLARRASPHAESLLAPTTLG